MSHEIYESLTDALATIGGAIPVVRCEEFTALIKELFTPAEAALAAAMPPNLNSARAIADYVKRPEGEIIPLLESMADKGIVFHQRRKGESCYKLMAVLPGFFEFQFMKGGYTDHDKKLARLFKEYFDQMSEMSATADPRILKKIAPFARVIPVEKEIPPGTWIQPYEKVSEYISSAEYITVSTCYCRHHGELLGRPCDKPKENCMAFGPNAQYAAERGFGRLVSKEEALHILDEAEKAGLVHCCSNTSKYIDFICNCCPCHCGIVQSLLRIDMPSLAAISTFRLNIDEDACTACEACVDVCPMKALKVEHDVVQVDRQRCIGCGVCNVACPVGALTMEHIPDAPTPPRDRKELTAAIMSSVQHAVE